MYDVRTSLTLLIDIICHIQYKNYSVNVEVGEAKIVQQSFFFKTGKITFESLLSERRLYVVYLCKVLCKIHWTVL